jgi:hypothetical protein
MSEYQDLDRVIRQTEEAIVTIKVAIAQHNSIPNQKAQLDYIAAIKEAEKWRQLFEQAQKNGDINQLHYTRERLRIHEDNAKKARQRMNGNSNVTSADVEILKQKLADLENKLAIAKAQRASIVYIDRSNGLKQISGSIDSGHYDIIIDPIPIDYEENWGNDNESIDNNDEQSKKQIFTKFSNSKHLSILDQAIEETRQTIAKVKQDYQHTLNSLEKNLKALEKAKQTLLKTDEVSPSRNEVIDSELEELRRQLDNL